MHVTSAPTGSKVPAFVRNSERPSKTTDANQRSETNVTVNIENFYILSISIADQRSKYERYEYVRELGKRLVVENL